MQGYKRQFFLFSAGLTVFGLILLLAAIGSLGSCRPSHPRDGQSPTGWWKRLLGMTRGKEKNWFRERFFDNWRLLNGEDRASGREMFLRPGSPEPGNQRCQEILGNHHASWGALGVLYGFAGVPVPFWGLVMT
jgi:hypothetical protein